MQQEPDSPEHHRQRSEFIRKLIQRRLGQHSVNDRYGHLIPRTFVQFWHDLRQLPHDVEECVASWTRWETSGFTHRLFDEHAAKAFISGSLGTRHEGAFERCYHPAMQADYFRLCYLLVEGGFYVDADDICVGTDIGWLFEDGRLKTPACGVRIPILGSGFAPLNKDSPPTRSHPAQSSPVSCRIPSARMSWASRYVRPGPVAIRVFVPMLVSTSSIRPNRVHLDNLGQELLFGGPLPLMPSSVQGQFSIQELEVLVDCYDIDIGWRVRSP